jgi:hypothetical protein
MQIRGDTDSRSRWLYTLFLAMDANFRTGLKNRGISDPELAPGWAYLVEETKYQNHIKNHVNQTEVNFLKGSMVYLSSHTSYRSIHVVHNTMPFSVLIHAVRTTISSLGPDLRNVHVTLSSARMVLEIYRKARSRSSRRSLW